MTDKPSEKPMRCPFCGGKGIIWKIPEDDRHARPILRGMWIVGCEHDLCPGYAYNCTPFYMSREMALDHWNRRGGKWEMQRKKSWRKKDDA